MPKNIVIGDESDGIVRVELAAPQRRNPLGPATCEELLTALRQLAAQPACRVVVLGAQGPVFSAGGDLKEMQSHDADHRLAGAFAAIFRQLRSMGKPVIAEVRGKVFGGGVGLVCACDLAVVASDVEFALPELALGIWPMMISGEIARSLGKKAALDLILTGRVVSGAEAVALGLASRAVAADQVAKEVAAMATQLARLSPVAMDRGLKAFYASQDMEYDSGLDFLRHQLVHLLRHPAAKEGLEAFLQKRKPNWSSK